MGPERRSVSADEIALFLAPPGVQRRPQDLLRHPHRTIFGAIQSGQRLSDNLLRRPAVNLCAPRIPCGNGSLRVKHGNRVVLDSIEKQMKPLLGCPRLLRVLLGTPPLFLDAGDSRSAPVTQDTENTAQKYE